MIHQKIQKVENITTLNNRSKSEIIELFMKLQYEYIDLYNLISKEYKELNLNKIVIDEEEYYDRKIKKANPSFECWSCGSKEHLTMRCGNFVCRKCI